MAPSGSSKAPGTGMTSIRSRGTPASVRVSSAPSRRRVVMSALKRLTTTPIARRAPFAEPDTTPTPWGMRSPPGACSSSAIGILVAQILVMQLVAQLRSLRLEVAAILRVRRNLDRHLLDDAEAEPLDSGHLLRVVRQDADRAESEVGENLASDAVLAKIRGEAELEVGLHGVEPGLLQLVGLALVQEADPAPLLRHVEKHSARLLGDPLERELQLLAAVAAKRMEDVAGQAPRVDAHEHVLLAVDVALDESDVVLARKRLTEGDGREVPVRRREPHGGHALDQLLRLAAVLDQVFDGDHLDPVPLAIRDEIGNSGHRAVLAHDLADHPGGIQAGQAGEVDRGLGLARALEYAARPGPQREDMAGPDEIFGASARVDRNLDGPRTVGGGDAGGHALARLDGEREGGAERRFVPVRHLAQAELLAALLGQAEADETAPVGGHEVDGLRSRELGRDRQIAFVLPVGGVDDDDELALAGVLESGLDRRERRGFDLHGRIVTRASRRAARTRPRPPPP